MSGAALDLLLRANLALSVAILFVLVLRNPVRRTLGAGAAYLLWSAPAVCLLASLAPAHAALPVAAQPIDLVLAATRQVQPLIRRTPLLAETLILLWAVGGLAAVSLQTVRQARFVRRLGRLSRSKGGVWRGQNQNVGPLVLGALRPRIVTPADFEARYTPAARRLILAHEGVHLRRGDGLVNAVVLGLQCLFWFNPLVHLAARRLRIDQEIACDAVVLARHPSAVRLYAETLLDAAMTPVDAPLACHWPAMGVPPLRARLLALSAPPVSRRRRGAGLAAVALLAGAGACAIWVANAAPPPRLLTAPKWIERPTGEDLARFYPGEAARAGTDGSALIGCGVDRAGRLRDCTVEGESPADLGFGEAALKLAPSFQMAAATTENGAPVESHVRIPINFRAAKPQP